MALILHIFIGQAPKDRTGKNNDTFLLKNDKSILLFSQLHSLGFLNFQSNTGSNTAFKNRLKVWQNKVQTEFQRDFNERGRTI